MFIVFWDDKNQEVSVQEIRPFGGASIQKCSAKAEMAQDAMHVAFAYVYDK